MGVVGSKLADVYCGWPSCVFTCFYYCLYRFLHDVVIADVVILVLALGFRWWLTLWVIRHEFLSLEISSANCLVMMLDVFCTRFGMSNGR